MDVLAAANVQAIEILWTLIAVGGVFLALVNVCLSTRAIRALKIRGIKNGRTRIAKGARNTEIVRLLIQLIETCLGVIAMTLPGSDLSGLRFSLVFKFYSIQYGLVACAILTLIQSVNSYRLRRFFLDSRERKDK